MTQSTIENLILATLIESKAGYDEVIKYGRLEDLSPISRSIAQAVERYRQLDPNVRQVDRGLLEQQIVGSLKSDKHVDAFRRALLDIPTTVSVPNVRAHLAEVHRTAVGQRLSLALANGAPVEEVGRLIAEYKESDSGDGQLAGSASPPDLVDCLDTSDLTSEKPNEQYIKLAPKQLNDRLDGGALRGHHVLVFARPEAGKTLFAINLVCGFLKQKLNVLYVGNEEPSADYRDRIRGRLLKTSKQHVRSARVETAEKLQKLTLGSIRILETTSFGEVRACLGDSIGGKHNRGIQDVLILDQVRNMRVKSDSRTAELEAAGIEARAIAKEFGVLVVSITQAGDSATNKVYLDMSDVDSSKTGIPASADLMIGIGADEAMKVNGLLGISLPKNKLSGLHDKFTVNVRYDSGEIN